MKWVHREILTHAYQRSWRVNATNEHDDKNFNYVIKRLPAGAADAIRLATVQRA